MPVSIRPCVHNSTTPCVNHKQVNNILLLRYFIVIVHFWVINFRGSLAEWQQLIFCYFFNDFIMSCYNGQQHNVYCHHHHHNGMTIMLHFYTFDGIRNKYVNLKNQQLNLQTIPLFIYDQGICSCTYFGHILFSSN